MLEAGVGDDRVQASEPVDGGAHNGAVAGPGAEVGVGEVDAVYAPALGLEPLDHRCADPAGGAGHERSSHPGVLLAAEARATRRGGVASSLRGAGGSASARPGAVGGGSILERTGTRPGARRRSSSAVFSMRTRR